MKQAIAEGDEQKRVIKHLRRADWLLIGLPVILVGILFIVVPIGQLVILKVGGERTDFMGFDMFGLLIIAGIIFTLIFTGFYGCLAFILSLLTRRNRTFRILLIGIPLLLTAIAFFGAVYFPQNPTGIPAKDPASENSGDWEKNALRFAGKITYRRNTGKKAECLV